MIPRGPLIVVLIVIELAILGGMVRAVRGGSPPPSFVSHTDPVPASLVPGQFVEGGAHKTFDTGAHPALIVDIGYADLTILARAGSQMDAGVSKSEMFGVFRATAPITAQQDGATLRIAKTHDDGFSMGDDRMVTVLVPPGTDVTVVNAGDIKVTGLRGNASIKGVGNGSVTVVDYDAPMLHVETSNGHISLHRVVTARLDADTSNGAIEGTGLQVHDGNVVTSNDHVSLGFAAGTDTLVTAETSNGTVRTAGFPASSATATHADASDDDDDDDGPSSQTLRIGAGTGRLDVHSSNGNIDLNQEG
jgi:hypothetical protein